MSIVIGSVVNPCTRIATHISRTGHAPQLHTSVRANMAAMHVAVNAATTLVLTAFLYYFVENWDVTIFMDCSALSSQR